MQRNDCIDFMKCIAAFMVIIIHSPFQGELGKIIMPLTRVAVPFFFVASGYCMGNFCNLKKKIKKTTLLLLGANAGYFLWGIFMTLLKGNSVAKYIEQTCNWNSFVSFLFFNESPFAVHLWFLGALLYGQIILSFLSYIKPFQKVYRFIPLLLLMELVFGKYSLFFFQREFDYIYVRNFAFIGIPYLLLGHCISFYKDKINTWKDGIILSGIVFFSVSTLLEKYILVMLSYNAEREHYISTIFLVVFLIAFAVKHPSFASGTKIAGWGRRYSLIIYLIHIVFLSLLKYFLPEGKEFPFYYVMVPCFIAVLSLFSAYLIVRTSDRKRELNC